MKTKELFVALQMATTVLSEIMEKDVEYRIAEKMLPHAVTSEDKARFQSKGDIAAGERMILQTYLSKYMKQIQEAYAPEERQMNEPLTNMAIAESFTG